MTISNKNFLQKGFYLEIWSKNWLEMTAHLLSTGTEKKEGRGLTSNLMIFLHGNWGNDHSFRAHEISFCMFYKELKQFLLPLHTAPWQYNHCSVAPSNSPRTALDQSGNWGQRSCRPLSPVWRSVPAYSGHLQWSGPAETSLLVWSVPLCYTEHGKV